MSQNVRQSNLFAAEDFTKIYQSFKNVDFKAYDYDTIVESMVNNLRIYYPESFNDFIDSSEFIAHIQLLASIASSLSFRVDLNTRDNFLDTAERKDSVIRLAKILSYQPKRNMPATGLFKIVGVQTNEPVKDSLGRSLENLTIFWNDPNNQDSYDQFTTVMNSVFSSENPFGRPYKQETIDSNLTALYRVDNVKGVEVAYTVPIYVNNQQMNFEVVSVDLDEDKSFVEMEPDPNNTFQLLYRNDGQGISSKNSGFFFYVKQGKLQFQDNQFDFPVKNRVIDINQNDINELDVYVQKISTDGTVLEKWKKVPNTNAGANIIYNSLALSERNIYSVLTRNNDSIGINFPDGNFGEVPTGTFRTWYRKSANQTFTVRPDEASGLEINMLYNGKDNQEHTVRFIFALQESINNSAESETIAEIKSRAPQVYYTQNRMVNNEDYNVFPLVNGNQIAKIRSVNRTHAGHSRFVDINDPTGFYQNLIIESNDGAIYRDYDRPYVVVDIQNEIDEEKTIASYILENFADNASLKTFFYNEYLESYVKYKKETFNSSSTYNQFNVFEFTKDNTRLPATHTGDYVLLTVPDTDFNNKGYLANNSELANIDGTSIFNIADPKKNPLAASGQGELEYGKFKFLTVGSKIKFVNPQDDKEFRYVTVTSYTEDENGTIFTFDVNVKKNWYVKEVYPSFNTSLPTNILATQIKNRNNFSISFSVEDGVWSVSSIFNVASDFDYDVTTSKWLVYASFDPKTQTYEVRSRGLKYVFESYKDVRFFFDSNENIFDTQTLSAKRDIITLPTINKLSNISEVWVCKNSNWVSSKDSNISYPINYISLESRKYNNTNVTVKNYTSKAFIFNVNNGVLAISNATAADGDVIEIIYSEPNKYLEEEISWNINKQVYLEDGYLDTRKVEIVPVDSDSDGIPDDVFSFSKFVSRTDIVFLEDFKDFDGYTSRRLWRSKWLDLRSQLINSSVFAYQDLLSKDLFLVDDANTQTLKNAISQSLFNVLKYSTNALSEIEKINKEMNLFLYDYLISADGNVVVEDVFNLNLFEKVTFDTANATLVYEKIKNDVNYTLANAISDGLSFVGFVKDTTHQVKNGRSFTLDTSSVENNPLFFVWKHYAPTNNRIDPSVTNIIDMTLLTSSYYSDVVKWKNGSLGLDKFPTAPTPESLRTQFSDLNKYKMSSDQLIYSPAKFKMLFGKRSETQLRAKFKIIRNANTNVTENEIKSRVVLAIDDFFDINNWDFGESFYYTELAAYIHQKLSNVIASAVIVPQDRNSYFGDLFQIKSEPNELFLSTATVSDVEIVSNLTEINLRA